MLFIGYLIILNGHKRGKIGFGIFHFEPPRVENCISRLCSPLPPSKHPNWVKNT